MDFTLGAQDASIKYAAQIQATAKTLGVDPTWVLIEAVRADPTADETLSSGRYIGWILKQMKFRNIILPEDRFRVFDTLELFEEIKRVGPQGIVLDINRYRTMGDLEDVTDRFVELTSGREKERPRRLEEMPEGAEVFGESQNYRILEVTHPDTCIYLSRGTKWCTREMTTADSYIERYGKLFVILAKDRHQWVVMGQYTPDYAQVMDTKDQPLEITDQELADLMGPDLDTPDAASKAILYAQNIVKGRWLKAEPIILENPRDAVSYAKYVIHGRWPEAEPIIAKNTAESMLYAKHIVQGPWPLGEPSIAEDGHTAYNYAVEILHDRFPLGEPAIARLPGYATLYAQNVLRGRFLEAEPFVAQDPEWAVDYAKGVLQGRFPEGEPAIASKATTAYDYASHVIDGLWPMGEAAIASDPDLAVAYARDFLEGPFPQAEEVIAQDAQRSYIYARDVLGSRFPAGEPAIAKEPQWAFFYARDVIRGRWPQGEPALYRSSWWIKEYEELFS